MHTANAPTIRLNEPADGTQRAVWAAALLGGVAAAALVSKGLWWLAAAGVPLAWHCLYRRQIERLVADFQDTLAD